MRTVVRNSFARHTVTAERVPIRLLGPVTPEETCTECGQTRGTDLRPWLYRFHVDDDSGSRHSGAIADGKLFCSWSCAESYIGHPFDEGER